jgi:hypothetical protein
MSARLRLGAAFGSVVLTLALAVSPLEAAPVPVKLAEGNLRGFLVLRPMDGPPIGYGELRQHPKDGVIESRLLLNFKDGSLYDETATYSQARVFTLERYRLRQRGPSFPTAEISFDRKTRQYQALVQDKLGAEEKRASGELEMPPDLYNGMALVLLKNLAAGEGADVRMAAFTPKARLLTMHLRPEAEETAMLGNQSRKVTRYLVKLEIGGLTGVIASLLGKKPPDLRYWFVTGDVPAFVKFQGAMFLNGPVWRLELTTVEWPKTESGR